MKVMYIKGMLLGGVAAAALTVLAGQAQAGGFSPHEQSAGAQGASFAGVAAGAGGLSAMFWNPATITNTPGWQSSWQLSGILPYANNTATAAQLNITGGTASTGNQADSAVLPASYSSYQWNDNIWLGLALNTPYGLGTQNPPGSSAQFNGLTSSVMSENINPNIAYKFNETISVALGLQVQWFKTRQTAAVPAINLFPPPGFILSPATPLRELKGSSWGVGFTAGITLKPWQGTEIGIGYRSAVRHNITGDVNVYSAAGGIALNLPARVSITLPDTYTIGIRQQIAPQWTLLAGFEYMGWSKLKAPVVFNRATGATITQLFFDYKDGWMASLGAEYKWSPEWTFRGGLAYEKSPIDNINRDVRLLDGDRVWASLGASYRFNNKMSLDLAYSHVFVKSGTINVPARAGINLPYSGVSKGHSDILSVALNYRWDDPKVAAPVFAKH